MKNKKIKDRPRFQQEHGTLLTGYLRVHIAKVLLELDSASSEFHGKQHSSMEAETSVPL
jgi:hypothetical protein